MTQRTFFKMHHGFLTHPRYAELSNDALLLHLAGCSYASEHLTDGRLDKSPIIRTQWALRFIAQGADVGLLVTELVAARVWADRGGHFEIIGYLDHNNSRADVEAMREAARNRQAAKRERDRDASSSSTDNKNKSHTRRHADVTADVTRDSQRDETALDQGDGLNRLRAIRDGAA